MMSDLLYSVENFELYRSGVRLLSIEEFTIHKGDFILCAGPNGAGKTLLVRSLLGFEKTGGTCIKLWGKAVNGSLNQLRDRISYVPQHPENFMLGATVKEDLLFSSTEKLLEEKRLLLDELGIAELLKKPTAVLSGGEKKRVALASALITDPEILFLDEPFTELDYQGIKEMTSLLRALHLQGTSVFLITHDLSKILACASRVIILNSGKIVLDTSPEKLMPEHSSLGVRIPNLPSNECLW